MHGWNCAAENGLGSGPRTFSGSYVVRDLPYQATDKLKQAYYGKCLQKGTAHDDRWEVPVNDSCKEEGAHLHPHAVLIRVGQQ